MTHVDLVVAVRNEEEVIPLFVRDVRALQLPPDTRLRIVFVEDSSTDGTRDVLRRLAVEDDDLAYYLVKNDFGQGLALVFGSARCAGDAVITMDVDGTHPVGAIPVMITRFLEGRQVVQCTRRAAPDRSAYRNRGASAFHLLTRFVTGVNIAQQDIYFRLMSAAMNADVLISRPRYWRFVRFPLPASPGLVSFLQVDSIDRRVGSSKYNIVRLSRVAFDAVLSLMSRSRLVAGNAACLVAAVILWQLGLRSIPVLLVLAQAAVTWRYFALDDPTLLSRIQLLEQGGSAVTASLQRAG